MPCYKPLAGWPSINVNPSGKRSIVFKKEFGIVSQETKVSCGRCIGCRLERSRQTAIRAVHESKMHDQNAFLTLTYDDKNLPENGSLNKTDIKLFMKRYRQWLSRRNLPKIRFIQCGEYGDQNDRPHHHALIFGHDFEDKKYYTSRSGNKLYTSESLDALWGKGICVIGELTFESAAYVARYVMKKINGPAAMQRSGEFDLRPYERINYETGEIVELMPEYITFSNKPGIAKSFYLKFKDDMYPEDEVISRGMKLKPPKYYDKLYDVDDPDSMASIKEARKTASENSPHNTPRRLADREKVKKAQISLLSRDV